MKLVNALLFSLLSNIALGAAFPHAREGRRKALAYSRHRMIRRGPTSASSPPSSPSSPSKPSSPQGPQPVRKGTVIWHPPSRSATRIWSPQPDPVSPTTSSKSKQEEAAPVVAAAAGSHQQQHPPSPKLDPIAPVAANNKQTAPGSPKQQEHSSGGLKIDPHAPAPPPEEGYFSSPQDMYAPHKDAPLRDTSFANHRRALRLRKV